MGSRKYVGNGVWEDVDDGKPDPSPSAGVPSKTLENLGLALDDVATRFLVHLPASELASADRLFFQIEQAHWFYEDFLADAPGAKLPHLQMRAFAQHLFNRCALLKPVKHAVEHMFESFREYKGKIPVCGCILLDESLTKIVLVCNWAKTSWGLPKGKLNQNEPLDACAAREVYEETGYDASTGNQMDTAHPIEAINDGSQRSVMFIVPGVPSDFPFEPRVRKEISKVAFFKMDALPDKQWNVAKFVPRIKRWIKTYRRNLKRAALQKTTQSLQPPPLIPAEVEDELPPVQLDVEPDDDEPATVQQNEEEYEEEEEDDDDEPPLEPSPPTTRPFEEYVPPPPFEYVAPPPFKFDVEKIMSKMDEVIKATARSPKKATDATDATGTMAEAMAAAMAAATAPQAQAGAAH